MRIAIIVNGGLYAGFKNQGFPALMSLIDSLNEHHELIIYSLNDMDAQAAPYPSRVIKSRSFLKEIELRYRLKRDHKQEPFDLIHGFFGLPAGYFAVKIGSSLGIPSVVTLMGSETVSLKGTVNFGHLNHPKTTRNIHFTTKFATVVVTLSDMQRAQMIDNNMPCNRFEKIPFGVNVKKVNIRTLQTGAPITLVYVGNINPIKDLPTLLKSCKILSEDNIDFKLKIVGGDFNNGTTQELCRELEIVKQVEFIGQATNDEVIDYIRESDIVMIPSLSEGQSVVLFEAMSLGVPVCGTAVGILPEFKGKTCLTVDTGNRIALANSVKSLIQNPRMYNEFSSHGIEFTRGYNLETSLHKYLNLYQSLV